MSTVANSINLSHGGAVSTQDARVATKRCQPPPPPLQKAIRRPGDRGEYGSESGSYRSLATSTRWRLQRVTNSNASKGLQQAEFANTYRLGPEPDRRFRAAAVEAVTRRALAAELRDKRYDARECGKCAQVLCERIKHAVKELDFPRYKVVCNVALGEKRGQGVHVRSRSVWDEKLDSFAEATFENGSIFAVATVYGVYFE